MITWGASEHKAEATASKDRSVALEDVLELRPGHKTQAWWVQANAGRLIPPEDLCWSLVCKDRTLDLAAEDSEDAKAWRRGIDESLREATEAVASRLVESAAKLRMAWPVRSTASGPFECVYLSLIHI